MKSQELSDDLLAMSAKLERMANEVRPPYEYPLVSDVLSKLLPPARIHSYQGKNKIWYTHVVMPRGWVLLRENEQHWIYDENNDEYWFDVNANTRSESQKKAIAECIERFL